MNKISSALLRLLPRSLELQLMLLTSLCLVLSILGYGYYIAREETRDGRSIVTAQIQALARNLATVDAHFLSTNEAHQIEALTLQTATVPGIYSVLVTDVSGVPISEVVNNNGVWSPRYGLDRVHTPTGQNPDEMLQIKPFDANQHDFLAGNGGTLSAWRRIVGAKPLGWVRINYRMDKFDELATEIQNKALKTVALAIAATLALLWLLLHPAMRALRQATHFASQLDQSLGAQLRVSRRTTEIQSLGNALNVVSRRLLIQNLDLNNQKFALDQHAIVSITDLQGTITYANQRFCDISGYTQEELLGQNHRIVKSDEHPPQVFEELWHTITQGQVWRGDIKNRKKNGDFYWVNATIVPLMGVDGLPHQFIGIRTDITTNKNLELSLQAAKEQAEAAATTKGQFLANMSHEIRTPMNAVLGMLHLLQNTDLNKRQLDYTNKAESAAQSLLGLLNDILDFSKIDAGKMSLEVRSFRLDKLLRDLSVILASTVGKKPVEVLFDVDPATPKVLMGDALRLQQVLINLCSNAVKFTAQGEVILSVRVIPWAQPDDSHVTLHIAVQDSGIGIAPENQNHIFDGFSQAEASTTRRFGGTGLGLSISRRLVGLMGGDLRLQSELGRGSTFSFQITLPISHEATPISGTPVNPLLATGLQVLLVDDNPTAREVLASMAQSLGWQVDVAATGPQALAQVEAHNSPGQTPYQAIFLDWQMAGMDGWETLARLPDPSDNVPSPVIVMITAHGREMLSQRSPQEQARLHGFLVKPVTASMLLDAVSDALASRHTPSNTLPAPLEANQPLSGTRLLVVEDNMINQQVAHELLSSQGALVTLADNGQIGVDAVVQAIAEGTPFDVVLMDIQMPVMDGYSATRVLREELGLTDLPIIAMTANAMASDREACLAAGMNDHVGKPFNLAQLVELINHPKSLGTRPTPVFDGRVTERRRTPPPPAAAEVVIEVDTASALERLGDNQALYRRVLQSFLQDMAGLPVQLDACLSSGDLAGAARLLHALKGLASTVGANPLAAVARKAEFSVKDAQINPQLLNASALGSDLRAALDRAQEAMQLLAQSLPVAHGTGQRDAAPTDRQSASSQADHVSTLRELQTLLKASNMHAIDVYEQWQRATSAPDSPELKRLRQAMSAFDFDQAAQACQQLLDQTHVSLQT